MAKRPDASVVARPTSVGSDEVASNNVTTALASGELTVVPPVCTTPLNDFPAAETCPEIAHMIAAAAISQRLVAVRTYEFILPLPLWMASSAAGRSPALHASDEKCW